MPTALRALGLLLVLMGAVGAGVAAVVVIRDEQFAEVAAAYARHPDHALFRAEYLTAAARHYGVLVAGVLGLVAGLAGGGMLIGIAELLRRVPERDY
jgi:hypothetical protein